MIKSFPTLNSTDESQLNLFPTPAPGTPNPSSLSSMGKHVKEWRGGAKYNRICCIGKGAFAVVYKISDKFDGVPYAAKELEKRRFMKNGILDQKIDSEMKIMKKIKHVSWVPSRLLPTLMCFSPMSYNILNILTGRNTCTSLWSTFLEVTLAA
jgi:serine/threonine protein kinase